MPQGLPLNDAQMVQLGTAVGDAARQVTDQLTKRLDEIEIKMQRVPAAPRKPESTSLKMAAMVSGLLMAKDQPHKSVMGHMDDAGFGALARSIEYSAKTLNASSAVAGGILVPTDMSNEIIELLRPSTAFLRGNPTRVPMPRGNFTVPGAATGAQASYTTEGQPAAVTEPSFREVRMSAKTLAAIVPVTNDILKFSAADLESYVVADLVAAMSEKMDWAAFRGDGVSGNPLGIYNIGGFTSNAAANTATPTVTQVDADLRKCINGLVAANVPLDSARWVMNSLTFGYLQDIRDGNGGLIYETLMGPNPTLKGLPVVHSTNVPNTEGVGSNETTIGLVAFRHVLLGDSGPLELAVSREASITINGQMISLFQNRMTAVLAVASHDFNIRHRKAISLLTGVKWGN
jgi:HK97 family phage major capsid protein